MDAVEGYRVNKARPYVRGRLLDVGCGFNNLVREYGSGTGADVHPWPGVDVIIPDAGRLPFREGSFDTVTMIAVLNHVPHRREALVEARRVLGPSGRLLVTMIGPVVGRVAHLLFVRDERQRGGMKAGELLGMRPREVRTLLFDAGFEIVDEAPFEFGLNRLYIATKSSGEPP